jgi:hypothetical protein
VKQSQVDAIDDRIEYVANYCRWLLLNSSYDQNCKERIERCASLLTRARAELLELTEPNKETENDG